MLTGVALAALIVGALIRNNAVFAVGPLLAFILRPAWLRRPVFITVGSVVLGLALVPASNLINRHVLVARDAGAIRSLMLFDLVGTAVHSRNPGVFGESSRVTLSDVDRCYTRVFWDTFGRRGRCGWFFERIGLGPHIGRDAAAPRNREALSELRALWLDAITRHPLAYAEHRLRHFNSTTYFIEPLRHAGAEAIIPTGGDPLKRLISDWVRYAPPLAPAVMLALAISILAVIWLTRLRRPSTLYDLAIATALSALLYGLSFLAVGVATDLRYFFFVILGTLLALVFTTSELLRDRDRPIAPALLACAIAVPGLVMLITLGSKLALGPPKLRPAPARATAIAVETAASAQRLFTVTRS